ncbi:MAG: tRNA preQ1(34) S-adenosylmethionine ribosyltransferase-isomerase QueA [Alphaproteobacteria bacterium]
MRVDDFDFELPPESIALRLAEQREKARLLVVRSGVSEFEDRHIADLPHLLQPGDVVVVNDTRVIPARLTGCRERGAARAKIDVTLHKRESADHWLAFVRPAKKLDLGEIIHFRSAKSNTQSLNARVESKGDGGEVLLRFSIAGAELDALIAQFGEMPLPPYIAAKRAEDEQDEKDYQTIFADRSGAVAAPTAGLHFTSSLIDKLRARGIDLIRVTLHVGAGTFLPVKVEDTRDHKMHAEWGEISSETADRLNRARQEGRRIVSIGTTSLRLLESAVQPDGSFVAWSGDTSIFITPGYRFKAVDVLLTNFHLPRSTLVMLVSAFSGLDRIMKAYRHAIETGYRFYSYGDACLLFRVEP